MHSWGGLRQWVRRVEWGGGGCKRARVRVCECVCTREGDLVIAREEPCARRTLKLIKGGDRVIIHYGPLERLTLKSLLLINSETVLRINNNIKKGMRGEAQTHPGSGSSFLITIK